MGRILGLIGHELREGVVPLVFFLVAFHMVGITKLAVIEDYHITAATATISTVAAMLVAKAILVTDSLPVARWFSRQTILNVLWLTLVYGLIAMLFRLIEEWIGAIITHGSIVLTTEKLFAQLTWPRFLVIQMWLFAFVFLYCLCASFVRAIGAEQARAILFGPAVTARAKAT